MAALLAALAFLAPETGAQVNLGIKKKAKPQRDPDDPPALIQGMAVPKLTAATPPGRFQLVVSGTKSGTLLLCDTATGQVWYVPSDGSGMPVTFSGRPAPAWQAVVKPLVKE